MDFVTSSFEHNKELLLFKNSFPNFRKQESSLIDHELYELLIQLPNLSHLSFPLSQAMRQTLLGILSFRLAGGSPDNYATIFGAVPTIVQTTGSAACGKVFKKGDGIYRCIDCGFDETCVMCVECFKASDHENHEINFRYSEGNGGCCDCGDKEAWKVPGTCKIHCVSDEMGQDLEELSSDVLMHIKKTIATTLEFILSVIDHMRYEHNLESIENIRPNRDMDLALPNSQELWSILLWNDDYHSFDEVISQMSIAVDTSEEESKEYAHLVDSYGRHVVKTGSDLISLHGQAKKFTDIALVTSIEPTKDVYREYIAGFLLEWLKSLPKNVVGFQTVSGTPMESVEKQIRLILCQELDQPSIMQKLNTFNPLQAPPQNRLEYFLIYDRKMWLQFRSMAKEFFIGTMIIQGDHYKKRIAGNFANQYISLAHSYINDDNYEQSLMHLSVQLLTSPSIVHFLVKETNLVNDILSIQKIFYLQNIYSNDINIKESFFDSVAFAKTKVLDKYPTLELKDFSHNDLLKIVHLFNDLYYITTGIGTPNAQGKYVLFSESNVKALLDFVGIFEAMCPQKRALFNHVEYEWEQYQLATQVSFSFLRTENHIAHSYIAACKNSDVSQILNFVSEINDALLKWTLEAHYEYIKENGIGSFGFRDVEIVPGIVCRVPDVRIAIFEVSLYHPLLWLYGTLMAQVPKYLHIQSSSNVMLMIDQVIFGASSLNVGQSGIHLQLSVENLSTTLSENDRQMLIYDGVFQFISFIAQIRSGLWVRNGITILEQARFFKETLLREFYDRNLFLLQIAAIKFGGDVFLTQLIDRFDVQYYFTGNSNHERTNSFTPENAIHLVEDLFETLIYTLTERTFLQVLDSKSIVKKEVVHQLAVAKSGLAYTSLISKIGAFQQENDAELIAEVLKTVANFRFPEGLTDNGLYTLKDEYYDQVDTWFWHYTKNQREDIEEILKKHHKLKYKNTIDHNANLNLPKITKLETGSVFDSLGNLVDSPIFSHMLLAALYHVTSTLYLSKFKGPISNETIFGEVIYLLLVAVEQKSINPGGGFFRNVLDQKANLNVKDKEKSRPTTLLDMILCMVDHANEECIKDFAQRLRYIVTKFEQLGGPDIAQIISGWRDKSNWGFFNDEQVVDLSSASSEAEKKKLAAKARQAAILAQFAQAQSSFMANYGEEMDDLDDDEMDEDAAVPEDTADVSDTRKCNFVEGSCIVCQEDLNSSNKLYGLLCLLQKNSMRRQVDYEDAANFQKVLDSPLTFDETLPRKSTRQSSKADLLEPEDIPTYGHTNRNGYRIFKQGLFSTTCGHKMHIDCFQSYVANVFTSRSRNFTRNFPENIQFKEYLCPLCKAIGNTIIPILWSEREERVNWNGTRKTQCDADLIDGLKNYIITDVAGFAIDTIPKRRPSIVEPRQEQLNEILAENEEISQITIPGMFPQDDETATRLKSYYIQSMSTFIPLFGTNLTPSALVSSPISPQVTQTYELYLFKNLNNLLPIRTRARSPKLSNIRDLSQFWDMFIDTVCHIEIYTRGSPPIDTDQPINSLKVGILDRLNSSTLNLLRILAETGLSTVIMKRNSNVKFVDSHAGDFLACIFPSFNKSSVNNQNPALLMKDGFSHLVNISMTVIPIFNLTNPEHIFYWIRLFGFFEVVRGIVSVVEAIFKGNLYLSTDTLLPANNNITNLLKLVISSLGLEGIVVDRIPLVVVEKLCMANLLVYSRKCVLFLYARYGMVPPEGSTGFAKSKSTFIDQEQSELQRLSSYLSLLSFDAMCGLDKDSEFASLCGYWCDTLAFSDLNYWRGRPEVGDVFEPKVTLEQVIVFELIELPYKLEVLFEEALTRKCVNCQKGRLELIIVPTDPAVCLLCGEFVCVQNYCCGEAVDETLHGECNIHKRKCGLTVGLYFHIKKCIILFLSNDNGCLLNPPYLDAHGEVDIMLRRGNPQFLNWKRYDEVRKLWLTGLIPGYVARKIEQSFDQGGWITY
ncbi:hypothetical protein HDV01_006712 [Terramyces sp. JEL0728]|nr:hypothetical protein HDV01_006712 [Terramyces sp. JEL0728]